MFNRSESLSRKKASATETEQTGPSWLTAVRAAEDKKATAIRVLDLREISSFTDHFVICTGSNARQNQAIADGIALNLKQTAGELPLSQEGYDKADWILMDYGDFLVHIFSQTARDFYDLERLWRNAKDVAIPE